MRVLAPFKGRPTMQLVVQTAIVAVLSAFMNNVGALALMLPVALRQAYRDGYSPAIALMPLALPLEIIIVVVSVPLILVVWPW